MHYINSSNVKQGKILIHKIVFGTIDTLKVHRCHHDLCVFQAYFPLDVSTRILCLLFRFFQKAFFFARMICTFHAVGFFDHLSLKTFTPSNAVLSAISSTPIVLCANLNLHLRLFRLTCFNFPLFFSKGTGSGF